MRRLLTQLGDANPYVHGGYYVHRVPRLGVIVTVLEAYEDEDGAPTWAMFRFSPDRCTWTGGVLSDNEFHPDTPAWFADELPRVAEFADVELDLLVGRLCSPDPVDRAMGYRAIGEFYGWGEFDAYPLTTRDEDEARAWVEGS